MEITQRLSALFLDMSSNIVWCPSYCYCTLSSYIHTSLSGSLPLSPAMGDTQRKKALSQHYPEKHRGGRGTLADILPIAQQKH